MARAVGQGAGGDTIMNTSRKYQIYVEVRKPMSSERKAMRMELEPEYHREFNPIKTCSDDIPIGIRMATGEFLEHQAKPLRENRKDLALRLGMEIAQSLVRAMELDDTHNGYAKQREETEV